MLTERRKRGSQENPPTDDETGQGLVASQGQDSSTPDRRASSSFTDGSDEGSLCVGYSEIDKYAIKVYEKQFPGVTTMATSPKSTQKNYQTLTASSVDSLVRRLVSQENEGVSMIPEVRSFLTSHGFLGKNNHAILSLRTSKGFYLTTKETLSAPSLPRLMNWGTTVNGVCLTAKTSVSRKTGSGSTLSDILEEHPDPKYFLSPEQTQKILKSWDQSPNQSGQDDTSKSAEYTLQTA